MAAGRTISRTLMDSLHGKLVQEKTDSGRIRILVRLMRGSFQAGYTDSQLLYARNVLALAQKHDHSGARLVAYEFITRAYRETGRYPEALDIAFSSLQWTEQTKDSSLVLQALRHVMFVYNDMQEYKATIAYARRAQRLVNSGYFKNEHELKHLALSGYMNFIGNAFEGLNQLDSALHYKTAAYQTALSLQDDQDLVIATIGLGRYYYKTAIYDSAIMYYRLCIHYVEKAGFRYDKAAEAQLGLAKIYQVRKQSDSAIYYAKLSLNASHRIMRLTEEAEAASLLHTLYATQAIDSAYKYLALSTMLKDSLFDQEKIKETESVKYKEALRRQQAEQEKQQALQQYNNQLKVFGLVGGLILLMSIAFFLYRLRQLKHETQLKSTFTKRIHQIEMRALRAQMNPHFIFNCLNSINRYIVKSDHKTASNYLTKFARLIRLILDNSASETITLDKEIQTLQLYIDMEVLRFDNAFDYAIEMDEDILPETINIPSLLLQPYVENAIWHGLLNKETGEGKLWIRFRLSTEDLLIAEVEDNGIGREKATELRSKDAIKKKSYGMQISKDRIFLINELYNTNANVQVMDLTDEQHNARGTKVTVEIPIRNV